MSFKIERGNVAFFGLRFHALIYKLLYISTLRYSAVAASRRGVADLAEHLLNVSPNVDKIMKFGETFGCIVCYPM